MQRRHGWAVVTLALILGCISAACSKDFATVPPTSIVSAGSDLPILPSDALPGYVVHASGLDATTLAADALDPASLDVVLTGAGFETGIERRFTARWKPVTEVVARALRFASADGATAYLTWLRTHGADVLGSQARASDPPSLTDAIAFRFDMLWLAISHHAREDRDARGGRDHRPVSRLGGGDRPHAAR